MLVLSRKVNQSIMIGDEVRVVIVSVDRDQVKLGIEAPREITVHRSEVYDEIKQSSARRPSSTIRGSETPAPAGTKLPE